MTRDQQVKIVSDFMDRMKVKILEQQAKWPEDWNGVDLTIMIGKAFEYECGTADVKSRFGTQRVKDVHNEIIVKNLV
jgi:hypothetical protein